VLFSFWLYVTVCELTLTHPHVSILQVNLC